MTDVRAEVYQGLLARGLPEHIAQGFMMNFQDESGFDVDITEGEANVHGTYGKGLYQLTGSRRDAFEARYGSDYSIDNQLDWLMHELSSTESAARDRIFNTSTAGQAGAVIVSRFLRPAKKHEEARREAYLGGQSVALSGGGGSSQVMGQQGDDTLQSIDPAMSQRLYDAYTSGQMNAQQIADYEADVAAGLMPVPTGAQIAQPVNAQVVTDDQSQQIYDAYINGRMTPQQEAEYIADVQGGMMLSPATGDQLAAFSQQRMTPMAMESLGMPAVTPAPPTPSTRGRLDLTGKFAGRAGGDLFMSAGAGLTGQAPSPTAQMTPDNVLSDVPVPMLGGLSLNRAGDAALTALGGLGALGGGAAGLGGDAIELVTGNRGNAQRFARDFAAIPESLAGSPAMMLSTAAPRATRAAPQVEARPRPALDVPADHTRPIQPPVANTAGETAMTDMQPLMSQAVRGNDGARLQIASQAEVNPGAVASAERIGIEAPVDVFADNAVVRQAAGMVRAVRGTDASAEWEETIVNAQRRASEILQEEGASTDLAAASERVQDALDTSITQLTGDASAIYDDVRGQISNDVRVMPSNTMRAIEEMGEEVGGLENLDKSIVALYRKISAGDGSTYGLIDQERRHVGSATFERAGPYVDADTRNMQRIYAAMREDQTNFVRTEVGDDAAERMIVANDLYSQASQLKSDMVSAFGKDLQGSIANRLRSAVTNASRGDAAGLNRVMNVIPENLQREALLSAIDEVVTVQSGQGGFSFANYAKTYRGLRENAPIYSQVSKTLGDDSANVLRDLYEVSARMDRASQNVPRTGASNQTLLVDSAMERFLNGTVGRNVRGVAAGMAGSAAAGPMAGSIAAVAGANGKVGRNKQRALGSLFRDPRFQRMMVEAAQNPPSERALNAVRTSPAYRRWARVSNIPDPDAWLLETFARGASLQEETQGQ